MDQSFIKSRQEFDDVVDGASQQIFSWMQAQLDSISRQIPILRKVSNSHYIFSIFDIKKYHEGWRVYKDSNLIHTFLSFSTALFYCWYYFDNNINEANVLKLIDEKLSNYILDSRFYQSKLHNAKNSWQQDLSRARLSNIQQEISSLKKQMQKSLIIAKYKKIRKFL